MDKLNIAIVTVHPDDAEFQMGGTIIKYVKKGHKVTNIICTNGDAGTNSLTREEIVKIRLDEALEGSKVLGTELIMLGFYDQMFLDTVENRLVVLDALRQVKPDIVFTLNPKDTTSSDHRVGAGIGMDMSFIISSNSIKTECPRVDKVPALYFMDAPGEINFSPIEFVDISDVMDLKKEALAKHKSQFEWMNSLVGKNSSLENMETINRFRGFQCGVRYAEAFEPKNTFTRGRVNSLLPQYI